MLTVVHDKDVYRDGYESRQPEIEALESAIEEKEAKLSILNSILIKHGINPDEELQKLQMTETQKK